MPRTTPGDQPLSLFLSYSHLDETYHDELRKHLEVLRRTCNVQPWHDRRIVPGQDWESEILEQLDHAHIILPLISSDFIASDYCYGIEMARAMERHARGDAIVIPVILRPCDWHSLPVARLQVLPKDGKPIATWTNQDEALTDTVRGVRLRVNRLRARGYTNAAIASSTAL